MNKYREVMEEVKAQKLEISKDKKRLLKVRKKQKKKKPKFKRTDSHKKKKLKDNWRKPRGLHNKLRKQISAKGKIVKIGYGSPKKVRGLHPSGFEDVLVRNLKDINNIDPSTQAIRIAGTIGKKKRLVIEEKAKELNIKILNPLKKREKGEQKGEQND
ncbi:MAG: 50S ribosomal protein L32e [Methanosarcinales archaeon]